MELTMRNVIGLTVGMLMAAILLPVGLTQWFSVNTTPFPQTVQTIWPLVGLLVVIGILLAVIPRGSE